MEKIGDIVYNARRASGLSQKKLGDLVGVWATYIGQIEKRTRIPSDETIAKIAKVFGFSPEKLLILGYYERADTEQTRSLFREIHKHWDRSEELTLPNLSAQQRTAIKKLYLLWSGTLKNTPSASAILKLCSLHAGKVQNVEDIIKAFES